ncbi:MAG: serine/threonine protein kinase [Bacteroidales bacterium]|nr:serine/threonine protein kinase [Bacteroidales bacterium]
MEPLPGYRLVRPLGRGGFGEVWEAIGPGGLPVALKGVPLGGRSAVAELRALDAVRGRRHPHLLALFGAWQTADRLVIAAELADGSLWDRYQQAAANGQVGIPTDELLGYFRETAEGLDFLNSATAAVAHRDVKPQNLLLVGGGVKVADFGLARAMGGDNTGHSGGMTVGFAPPEAFNGKTSRTGDQYSLAVTYCLLRGGRMPFAGSPAALMKAHIHEPPDLSMLPLAEQSVVARALAKQANDRWPDCRSFVAALEGAMETTANGNDTSHSHSHSHRSRWLLVGVVLLVAVVVLAGSMSGWSEPRNRDVAANHNAAPVAAGERLSLRGHTGTVSAVTWTPDGKHALSGGFDATVREWDLTTGAEIRQFRGHTAAVRSVAVSPDGKTLLTASGIDFRDLVVRVWDMETGNEVGQLTGHEHNVQHVVYHPDGQRAVTASMDGTARVWSVPERRELLRFEGLSTPDVSPPGWPKQVWGLSLSASGDRAACGLRDGTVRVFDTDTGQEVGRFPAHAGPANAVAWVAGGRLLSGSGEVWGGVQADNTVVLMAFPGEPERWRSGHRQGVRCLATAGDRSFAITGGVASEVIVWDTATRQPRLTFPGHPGGVWAVAISAGKPVALTGGGDGVVRLWSFSGVRW